LAPFLFVCPVNVKKLKSRLGFRVWGLSFGLWVRRRGKSGRCHGLRLCFEDFGFLLCFGLFACFEVLFSFELVGVFDFNFLDFCFRRVGGAQS